MALRSATAREREGWWSRHLPGIFCSVHRIRYMCWKRSRNMKKPHGTSISTGRKRSPGSGISHHHGIPGSEKNSSDMYHMILSQKKCWWYKAVWGQTGQLSLRYGQTTKQEDKMFPSYLPVKAPDPGAYHFNFLGHNQKCLTLRIPLFHTIFTCKSKFHFGVELTPS